MYKVLVSERVAEFIRGQTKKIQRQLVKKIKNLGPNPFPANSVKLKGHEGLYRIVSGYYRIIYTVKHKTITVLVLRIAHRKEVYKRLS
ncbi:MAG: type II toxin-antitoxin system RelE/ParE family toxin [Planctomycetes bacterium]|nr:type II toxin-antitoxin system RelE/ParE family toxin [Planctomycetota bacterium]